MMAIVMKHAFLSPSLRRIGALFALGAGLVLPPESAADPAGDLQASPSPQPVAYLKGAPLQELMDRFVAIAQAVQPSPQIGALPFIVGGMLGDPTLESLSREDDLTLVVFSGPQGDDAPVVIIVRLAEDSPIPEALSAYGLSVVRRDGYTLTSPDAALLDQIEDLMELRSIIEKPRGADIEVGVWLDRLEPLMPGVQIRMEALSQFAEVESMPPALAPLLATMAKVVSAEVATMDSYMLGMNLSAQRIELETVLRARAGSPLGDLLSQPTGGEVAAARVLPASGFIPLVARLDPAAWEAYSTTLFERFAAVAEGAPKQWANDLGEHMQAFWRHTDGRAAGMVWIVDGVPQVVFAGGLQGEPEAFRAINRAYNQYLVAEVFASLGSLDGESLTAAFHEAAHEHRGVTVDKLTFQARVPDTDTGRVEETYIGAVDGFWLTSNTPSDMDELIGRVLDGPAVDGSLAERLQLADGEAARFEVALSGLLRIILGEMAEAHPDVVRALATEVAEINETLLRGVWSIGEGRLTGRTEIAIPAIARMMRFFDSIQAAIPGDWEENSD